MTTIEIPEGLHRWLSEHAKACGITVEHLAERALLIYQGMIEQEKEFFCKVTADSQEANE